MDAIRDFEDVEMELILSDLVVVEKRMERLDKERKKIKNPEFDKEFALLESLMLRRGQNCSRAELLEQVWQMAPDATTNVLDVYVNYLRRKLGAVSDVPVALIETVRGIGYRMAARPAELPAAARIATSHLTSVVNA